MASHKKERTDSPAEAPEKRDESEEQSLARYATTVGIVTGLFGMLFGVGFILLPAATMREKVLVIGASLAVAVAGLTGVGAWRSPRRFGLTMFAGGLAIICLADLSIAAASGTQPTVRASGGGTPSHSSADTTPTPTPKPTPTATATIHGSVRHVNYGYTHGASTKISTSPKKSSQAGNAVFLSKLAGKPGSDRNWMGPEFGSQIMNKTEFNQSLGYPKLCGETTPILYSLGKPYRYFLAAAGIADGASTHDDGVEAAFEVDGKTGSGRFRLLGSAAAAPGGDPSLLDVPIPSGTTELQLTTTVMDAACMQDSTIVWGNARLIP